MKITSVNNDYIKSLTKLSKKKERDVHQQFLVEGEHLIEEARKSGNIIQTIGCGSGYDVEITEVIAKKLSTTTSGSKSFALVKKFSWRLPEGNRFLICDGIQDPGNLGTIIRTAHSFGFNAVILSETCVDEYNDKVVRSTQGSLFHIPVIRGELNDVICSLKKQAVEIVVTHLSDETVPLSAINHEEPLAFVLGSEGAGVSSEVVALADRKTKIETTNFESLNVAIAAAIICYAFRR